MASNPQHEPTMEEILASIRKIISEDSNEAAAEIAPAAKPAAAPAPVQQAAPPPPPPPAPVPQPVEEADVLELTQEVREEPAPAPADDVVFQPREEAAVSSAHADEPAHPHTEIFSDKSRKALDDSFASLDSLDLEDEKPAPAARMDQLPGVDSSTVEAVFERAVRSSFEPVLREWLGDNAEPIVAKMSPIIREWLDHNLPAILEEVVRDEVSRAVKARRR